MLVPRWSRVILQRLADDPWSLYRPIWSEWIIAETWRVLTRQRVEMAARAGRTVDWLALERDANSMVRRLLRVMVMQSLSGVDPLPPAWPGHPDPNDVPVWATALLAGAPYVISHDLRSFPPRGAGRCVYAGVEYLTAIEFIEQVLGVSAAAALGSALPPTGVVRSGRSV